MTNNKIVHWVLVTLAFVIPAVVSGHPAWLDTSIGSALTAILLAVQAKLQATA